MTAILAALTGISTSVGGGSGSDTQTVTVGGDGAAPTQDRRRGFSNAGFGSINDGTSNIYSGATIGDLYWDESSGFGFYQLTIYGAPNSGWSTMTIGGTSLSRTSATYTSGTWQWSTFHTVSNQAFGSIGNVVTVLFA